MIGTSGDLKYTVSLQEGMIGLAVAGHSDILLLNSELPDIVAAAAETPADRGCLVDGLANGSIVAIAAECTDLEKVTALLQGLQGLWDSIVLDAAGDSRPDRGVLADSPEAAPEPAGDLGIDFQMSHQALDALKSSGICGDLELLFEIYQDCN